MISYETTVDNMGIITWNENNKLHRTDGPAIIYPSGKKEYWINGKLHREDGSAIIWSNGRKEYWVNDKYYPTELEYIIALGKPK